MLAIAALDAAVDRFLDYGRSLQVVQMTLRIVSEHVSRRENIFRIGEALELPHQGGKFSTPFALNVGRDVAPGAVFSLERAVILVDNQFDDVLHERAIVRDFLRIVEERRDEEVQVASRGVTEDDSGVAVLGEQRLQIKRAVGEPLGREAYVLQNERRAGGPRPADRGQ